MTNQQRQVTELKRALSVSDKTAAELIAAGLVSVGRVVDATTAQRAPWSGLEGAVATRLARRPQ
jgi:hypothetical protein